MTSYAPADEQEAAAIVAQAAGRSEPLRLVGGGTKATFGRPPHDEATLSATRLSGITLYEPAEMVVAARAGTPLAEVEALLAGRGQMLPFEPMDHRPLLGSTGEPWDETSYRWYLENAGGGRCPVINISGGTEIVGCHLSATPLTPLRPCSLGGAALGMDVDVFTEEGRPAAR